MKRHPSYRKLLQQPNLVSYALVGWDLLRWTLAAAFPLNSWLHSAVKKPTGYQYVQEKKDKWDYLLGPVSPPFSPLWNANNWAINESKVVYDVSIWAFHENFMVLFVFVYCCQRPLRCYSRYWANSPKEPTRRCMEWRNGSVNPFAVSFGPTICCCYFTHIFWA